MKRGLHLPLGAVGSRSTVSLSQEDGRRRLLGIWPTRMGWMYTDRLPMPYRIPNHYTRALPSPRLGNAEPRAGAPWAIVPARLVVIVN